MAATKSSAEITILERAGVYIDGLNVMSRLRDCGWEEFFDVGYFAKRLAGNRLLAHVCYFRVRPSIPPIKSTGQYWDEIRHLQQIDSQMRTDFGKYVRYGYMVRHGKRWEEKKTDVWMGAQMVFDAATNAVDTLILVTADNDILPAAELVRYLGRSVELIVFPRAKPNVSQLLAEADLVRKARASWFQPYA